MKSLMRRSVLGWLVVSWLTLPACGYTLAGRGNFLPPYIKTIGIPLFVNHTSVATMGQTLTDATVAEFISRGRRVQPDTTGVDAILTATITSVLQTPIAFTESRQQSRVQIVVVAEIEFKDTHTDKVLWSSRSLQVRDQFDVSSTTTANDPNAFLSGDQNAYQRLAKAFAQQVVTSILEAF